VGEVDQLLFTMEPGELENRVLYVITKEYFMCTLQYLQVRHYNVSTVLILQIKQ